MIIFVGCCLKYFLFLHHFSLENKVKNDQQHMSATVGLSPKRFRARLRNGLLIAKKRIYEMDQLPRIAVTFAIFYRCTIGQTAASCSPVYSERLWKSIATSRHKLVSVACKRPCTTSGESVCWPRNVALHCLLQSVAAARQRLRSAGHRSLALLPLFCSL